MFQAPAFAKNQVTYRFRKTAAKDMCSLSARWSASLSPHHVLPLFPRSDPSPHDFKLEATTLRCLTQTGESLTSNLETPHAGGPRAPQPLARTSLETRKPLAGTEKGGGTTGKAPRIEF